MSSYSLGYNDIDERFTLLIPPSILSLLLFSPFPPRFEDQPAFTSTLFYSSIDVEHDSVGRQRDNPEVLERGNREKDRSRSF